MIKILFAKSKSLFDKKQGSVLSAAGVIMVTVFISGVLGLIRDRLLATFFSVDELGVYLAAFRLPNLLFELLVMGALSTAFIPVFTHYLVKKNAEEAFVMAASVINVSILVVIILSIPLIFFTKQISYILVPGFSSSERETMIGFTRIMLIGQLIPLVIGNFVTGMLQSFQRFLLPALAPIVYNIGIIMGIVFFASSYGLMAAVWGVVLGGFLYLLIQLPLLFRLGYRHKLIVDMKNPGVREVGKLMLPRVVGLGVSQIDTTIDLILASFLGTRFITIFNFAQRLQQLPISLFGATVAQAALPALSIEAAKKDLEAFKKMFLSAMHQILFFVLPASVIMMVLRIPVVRLVYGAAKFDWPATVATGQTLSLFAISIFAQSLVQLCARAFYSLYDTKTPVVIGVTSVVINTVLSIVFVSFLRLPVWSLAVSTSLASLVNLFLLLIFLYKKVDGFSFRLLFVPPLKMILASLVTGVSLYLPMKLLDRLVFDTTRVFDLILLTGVATIVGLSVYIFLAWFFDIEEVGTFFTLLQKMKQAPRAIFTQSEELITEDHTSIP